MSKDPDPSYIYCCKNKDNYDKCCHFSQFVFIELLSHIISTWLVVSGHAGAKGGGSGMRRRWIQHHQDRVPRRHSIAHRVHRREIARALRGSLPKPTTVFVNSC